MCHGLLDVGGDVALPDVVRFAPCEQDPVDAPPLDHRAAGTVALAGVLDPTSRFFGWMPLPQG